MRRRITGSSNPRLKAARKLNSRSGILKTGLFLMEGPRFISDQLEVREPEFVILSSDAGELARTVAGRAETAGVEILEVPADLFESLADTRTTQGMMGVCRLPAISSSEVHGKGVILLLDRVSDPGNMGTIIRTAAAFGCTAVIAGKGSCFPFLPKVTRASGGHVLSIPVVFDADIPEFIRSRAGDTIFIGADAKGEDLGSFRSEQDSVGLVIGSEPDGMSPGVRSLISRTVAIPMASGVESLNAAVSAAIILYELKRRIPPG